MTQLGTVWVQSWSALPGHVHAMLSSRHRVTPEGRRLWKPTAVVIKRVFPTVFKHSLPEPELNKLRDYVPGWERRELSTHEEKILTEAIDLAAPWLSRIADLLPRFDKRISKSELGLDSKRDALLKIITPIAEGTGTLRDDQIEAILAPYKSQPGEPLTSAGVRAHLSVPENADRARAALIQLGMPAAPADVDAGMSDVEGVLRAFLNAPGLPQFVAPAKRHLSVTLPAVDKAWADVLQADVGLWHWKARAFGLTDAAVPPLPSVENRAPMTPLVSRPWLDSSIADRLASALKTGAPASIAGARPTVAGVVDAETVRATSQLGLSLTSSQAVVALAAVIMNEYYDTPGAEGRDALIDAWKDDPELTTATKAIHRRVEQWRFGYGAFEGAASIPNQAVMHIAEPRTWYMSTVWRRAHTKEVQGDADFTPGYVWYLLTQLSTKTLEDIRTKRWPESIGGLNAPIDLADQPDEEAAVSVPERWIQVLPRVKEAGVDSDEVRDFLRGTWGSDEHRAQWDHWMDLAGASLNYEDLWDWWRRNEPE
jgi:hypothetical protein